MKRKNNFSSFFFVTEILRPRIKNWISEIYYILPSIFILLFAASPVLAGGDRESIKPRLAKIGIPFVENIGQISDTSVKYYANTFAGTIFLTEKGEIVYSLMSKDKGKNASHSKEHDLSEKYDRKFISRMNNQEPEHIKSWAIREMILGSKKISVEGIEKAKSTVNYFIGNDNWQSDVPSYNSVSLGEIYNGIELRLKAYGNNVEKLFFVKPGAEVSKINMFLEGAETLKINEGGELEIVTGLGVLKFTKPYAYQEINGKRVSIPVTFQLRDGGKSYSFRVASYNEDYPIIIDPLLASTFLGGNGDDYGYAIAIDSSGNVFVTGSTYSSDYPTTAGAYDTTFRGNEDIFVSKLDNNLTTLLASTFVGGNNADIPRAIALDNSGHVYVTGWTDSIDYPTTTGAYNTTYNGGGTHDIFILKLDNNLTSLLASTFLGGNDFEEGSAIAIDTSGNVYVAGPTASSNWLTTAGAYDTSYHGNWDGFVSKLDSNLTSLLASTFLGGSGGDVARSLIIDKFGAIYVGGDTWSIDFPTTSGAYDRIYNDHSDFFISKLNSELTTLLASTFLGGSANENGGYLALDSSGNVFVGGETGHILGPNDYPTTAGAYDTTFAGGLDIVVSKLSSDLTNLLASTFIGGNVSDQSCKLAIDSSDNVFVAGWTYSNDYPITVGAYDTSFNGSNNSTMNGFISKLSNNLTTLLVSTFIGGGQSDWDLVSSLGIDIQNNIYIVGDTTSADYPTTLGAYDTTYNGGHDAYISKLDNNLSATGTVAIPRTGQTICYDSSGNSISCIGTGQDGDIQAGVAWPNPRFSDNADGTITDKLTGLMWPKDAGTPDIGSCTGGLMVWQNALDYVACLNNNNYLGHNDWRLPNVNELESLINSDAIDAASWLNTQGFMNVQQSAVVGFGYWSSTTAWVVSNVAWFVAMSDGVSNYWDKDSVMFAWPVRDGPTIGTIELSATGQKVSYAPRDDGELQKGIHWSTPRFSDNGDGTVTDNFTGLTWLINANCIDTVGGINKSSEYLKWADALSWASNLATGSCGLSDGSHAGDWRLPNRNELITLIDRSNYNPVLPYGYPFTDIKQDAYWTSTTGAPIREHAIIVNMFDESIGNGCKDICYYQFYVWPVRKSISQPTEDKIAPTRPTMLSWTDISTSSVTLSWNASSDNVGVVGYYIYNAYNAALITTTSSTSYPVTGLTAGGTYSFYVRAYDVANNQSSASNICSVTLPLPNNVSTAPVSSGDITPISVPVTPPSGSPQTVTVQFPNGTSGGNLQIVAVNTPPASPPAGFVLLSTIYYISTTATYSSPVIVTFSYDPSRVVGSESNLRLFHWEGGQWVDVTVPPVDTVNHIIRGQVSSLSPFGIGYPLGSGGGGGGYSTGANENMIAVIAIFTISAGLFILRRQKLIKA